MPLFFREIKESHLETIRLWRNSNEVSRYMYTSPKLTREDQINWYRKIKNDKSKRYWFVEDDNQAVGLVNLADIDMVNQRAYVGHYIGNLNVQGKGYGKAIELKLLEIAFEYMKLNKVIFEVFSFNKVAINLHLKCGSKIEGILRQHVLKEGEFHDVSIVSILREEYLTKVKDKIKSPYKVIVESDSLL